MESSTSPNLPRTLLVLGSEGGIGRTLVKRARQDGLQVVGVDRTATDSLAPDIVKADLSTEDGLRTAMDRLPTSIDYVASVIGSPAGISAQEVLMDNFSAPLALVERVIDRVPHGGALVFVGSISRSASCVPEQRWRMTLDDGDPKINAAQVVSEYDLTPSDTYQFSKLLLTEWALALAGRELRNMRRVNVISPGAVATPALDDYAKTVSNRAVVRARHLVGRHATSEEVADVLAFVLYGSGSSWLNGVNISLDGGLSNYLAQERRSRSNRVRR